MSGIDDMKEVQKVSLDVNMYEGRKANIDVLEIVDIQSKYGLDGKELPAPQTVTVKKLRVATEVLDVVKMSDKDVPIRASELFSLVRDDKGVWGFSNNEKANLNVFMKMLKVSHPKDLLGKQVLVLAKQSGFLGFKTK